ncbi:hypothetical protein ACKEQ2_003261 [Pseudomonas aeruginosa]|uniref:hypothetical protein n=1 Tax=Pseudomonas aeruginosa TaxID=287 RepID=UPI000F7090FE|nr:hypothetical protein [Pseudomonas aeruginosa]EKQ9485598.1 hypothetical protein [Pseudomonas aeruginosa]ELO0707575.1 hypothetical protein [Pseudomonas aeruginosa]WIM59486.1 hypothetical protein L4H22_26660 [Pseudomonas aeruginosa]VDL27267.1 hypothetical protein BANRA_01341 [Pseudomonas aeruginosa]VDL39394.1 hypothetical protein BANRA_04450 [Pseudomonas aeruginosa]
MNKANECSCPSGDGSLVHPCPAHPAVEQAGGDERDFQAEGAQEVPSPVSQEYDRHLISLLRKGEALPGHQEEAADEIERLRDWNDHLNNTVLPNILNPTFLMLMKGGERLLDLCTKDGEFIGVSLNDMKDVFDWMVTHARIAPDQAALAQPSPAQAEQHWPKLEKPAQVGAIRFSAGVSSRLVVEAAQRLYEFESTPEKEAERIERLQAFREQCFEPLGTEFSKVLSENLVELSSDAKPEQAEAERPEIVATLFTPNEKVHNVIGFKAFAVAGDCDKEGGEFYDPEKLMTVAQHARIVGALRAKADQLREALEWRAENQAGQRELLRSVKAERDAALAEVAGLRSLLNSLLCYVERDIDRMRSDRDKSDNKEIYDRSISLAMERLKAAQNAVFTTEPGCDTAVELAAQTTQAQHSVPGKYDDVLLPFLKSMEHELHANAGKGDRPGWLQMDRRTALLEIYYHLAKLQKATKDNDAAGIVEYAADVANMSMMLVDVCGLLAAAPGKEGV